jgi:hypothetical protein
LEIKIYSVQRVREGREDKEGRTYMHKPGKEKRKYRCIFLPCMKQPVCRLTFKLIAVLGQPSNFVLCTHDNLLLCDTVTKTVLHQITFDCFGITALPNCRFTAVLGDPGSIVIFHVTEDSKMVEVKRISCPRTYYNINLHPDSLHFSCENDSLWNVWDLEGNELSTWMGFPDSGSLCVLPGNVLAFTDNKSLSIWDPGLQKFTKTTTHEYSSAKVYFAKFIMVVKEGDLIFFDPNNLTRVAKIQLGVDLFQMYPFSENIMVITGLHRCNFFFVDLRSWEIKKISHEAQIADSCILENGQIIAPTAHQQVVIIDIPEFRWKFFRWFWLGRVDEGSAWGGVPVEVIFSWVSCLWDFGDIIL